MSDTLSTLQAALSPKTGMQRIPFPLESYVHPSRPLTVKQLVNYYAEAAPSDSRTQAALIPTPGLRELTSIGTGPVHAINTDFIGLWYVASGTHFYRAGLAPDGSFVWDDLGDVGSPSISDGHAGWFYPVTIAANTDGAMICVPPNAWFVNHTEPTAHQLGGTFPGDATSVVALDGYFIFTSTVNGSQFFISRLRDPTDFDALDFANNDRFPQAGLLRVMVSHSELWFASVSGFEVWYNAGSSGLEITPGTSFFPFRPQPGAVIPYGMGSPYGMAFGDGSIWWVSIEGIVFRSKGYQAVRVSTHYVEEVLRIYSPPVAPALFLLHGGHSFFVINLPTRTLVYDVVTGLWHDRTSAANGLGPWRGNAAQSTADPRGIVGDSLSGSIFMSDPNVATEGGSAVLRQITMPPVFATKTARARLFCARLEVEMGTGGTPGDDVILTWADDGSYQFSGGGRRLSAGTAPHARVVTTRLGSFRQRDFRLSTTGRPVLHAVDADIAPGAT